MEQITISRESLDRLLSATCSFYIELAEQGETISEEQASATVNAIREAVRALGKDEQGCVLVWKRAH